MQFVQESKDWIQNNNFAIAENSVLDSNLSGHLNKSEKKKNIY